MLLHQNIKNTGLITSSTDIENEYQLGVSDYHTALWCQAILLQYYLFKLLLLSYLSDISS